MYAITNLIPFFCLSIISPFVAVHSLVLPSLFSSNRNISRSHTNSINSQGADGDVDVDASASNIINVKSSELKSRRNILNSVTGAAFLISFPSTKGVANARYILNDDGEYEEVTDPSWQNTWKERLDKAQSMTTDEVFMAARGAGNTDLRGDEPESVSSKKRRAMAGCRDNGIRAKSGVVDIKECTSRVLSGDYGFLLDIM